MRLLNIPFTEAADRSAAKKLGCRWRADCKCWSVPEGIEIGTLSKYLVRTVYPSAAQRVWARIDKFLSSLDAVREDAELGITLSAATMEILGEVDKTKGSPTLAECKQLGREAAVKCLIAGGYSVNEIRDLKLLDRGETPRLLCRDEVAAILQVTLHQASRLINSGELPTVRVCTKELRVPQDALTSWIRRRTIPGRAEATGK